MKGWRGVLGYLLSGLVVFAVLAFNPLTVIWVDSSANYRQYSCAEKLKRVGQGFEMYTLDYDGLYPVSLPYRTPGGAPATWDVLIEPYVASKEYFQCPDDSAWNRLDVAGPGQDHYLSYGMPHNLARNGASTSKKQIPHPERTILLAEGKGMRGDSGKAGAQGEYVDNLGEALTWRHKKSANFLFMDGHVKAYERNVKSTGGTFPMFEGYTFSDSQGALCGENDPLPQ